MLKSNLWKCNLEAGDIGKVINKNKYPFWHEVLLAWNLYNRGISDFQAPTQLIWWNSAIKIGNELVYWPKCMNAGLMYVGQLYKNNQLISMKEASEYGLTLMEFNSLISAIPTYWKQEIKSLGTCDYEREYHNWWERHKNVRNISKSAYKILSEAVPLRKKRVKWEEDLSLQITKEEFLKKFKDIYVVTNSPKLRSFPYRLVHRAIVTNIHLKHWGKMDTDSCTQCNKSRETYVHMLVWCEHVQSFWIQVESLMSEFNNVEIDFNVENIIWNKVIPNNNKNIKNTICLMAKQYIYRQRCLKKVINFREFKRLVFETRNIERYIAIKNN